MVKERIPEVRSLTGIRGVAALWVALFHLFDLPGNGDLSLQNVLHHGYIAVDLFFVLSGFVMSLSYRKMFQSNFTPAIMLTFLGRRLARVYPLYFMVCLFALIKIPLHLSHRLGPADFKNVIPANFLMIQTWLGFDSLEGPMWSISTEWAAYFLFPLLLMLMFGARYLAGLLTAVCVAVLILLCLWFDPSDAGGFGTLNINSPHTASAEMLRCFADFSLGLLAFRIAKGSFGPKLTTNGTFGIVTIAAIIALTPWRYTDVALVSCFVPLIVSISADRGPLSRFLSSRIVHTLGLWSYAIYLIHPASQKIIMPLVLKLLHHHVPASAELPLSVFGALPILFIVSAFAYEYIEKPGRRILQRFFANRLRPVGD